MAGIRAVRLHVFGDRPRIDEVPPPPPPQAGEFFGEMALLGEGVRNASVRCAEPLDLLFIPQSDFAALLDRLPRMRESIEQVAEARRERAEQERSRGASFGGPSDR